MNDIDTSVFNSDLEDVARERENFLGRTVNDFIDSVLFGIEGIRHQVFAPVCGLTYEEIETLVTRIDKDTLLCLDPSLGEAVALVEVVNKAKQCGCRISDDILKKIEVLTDSEALEVAYRIYAYNTMRQILIEHIEYL